MSDCKVILKSNREKSALQKHPWLYSGGIDHVEGNPLSGQTVAVYDKNGNFIGWAAYSPESQIRLRFWSFDQKDTIDKSFLMKRLTAAITLRADLFATASLTNAFRLVHAESDSLPGLVVDRYGDYLVVQILSAGMEFWREDIISILNELIHPDGIYERSDVNVRTLEGLSPKTGILSGHIPPDRLEISENGLKFLVEVKHGQKTGYYLDQRENRYKLGELTMKGSVLNCFAYTGGFTVYALKAGAEHVISLDSSAEALQLAQENIKINDLPLEHCEFTVDDVFTALRGYRDRALTFDTIILDPPKFAPTAAHAQRAARAYKDINLLSFKLLKPGGTLLTFSCSGGIDQAFFQKIVADAALDAEVDAKIIGYMHQSSDHPISLRFPEGEYLKGLICRV